MKTRMLPVDEEPFGGRYNEDFLFATGFEVELPQLNSKNCAILEPHCKAAWVGIKEDHVWCCGRYKGGCSQYLRVEERKTKLK